MPIDCTRGLVASGNTYTLNEETGEIAFENEKTDVEVKYKYELPYGVNFMSLGKKTQGSGAVVTFDEMARLYKTMGENPVTDERYEYEGSRTLVDFTRSAEQSPPEIQALSKKPDTDPDKLKYKINSLEGPVIEISKIVYEKEGVENPVEYIVPSKGFAATDQVKITNTQIGEILLDEAIYTQIKNGTSFQVHFRINAGTTVHYSATFPKGVPAPIEAENEEETEITGPVESEYAMTKIVKSIVSIRRTRTGVTDQEITGHEVTADGKIKITDISTIQIGDKLVFEYKYMNGTIEIAQVAMFSHPKETDHLSPPVEGKLPAKMFNISGIGPINKDQNTEMVITWSVTF
jgi:hypothetical protein